MGRAEAGIRSIKRKIQISSMLNWVHHRLIKPRDMHTQYIFHHANANLQGITCVLLDNSIRFMKIVSLFWGGQLSFLGKREI